MKKRDFLKNLAGLTATLPLFHKLDIWMEDVSHLTPEKLARDEAFWSNIRSSYRLKPDYINLENGYYCISPQETLNAFVDHIKEINYQGSYYMRTTQWDNKDAVAQRVAEVVGVNNDELVITRNTTESLDTIIGGYPWQPGDEAVYAEQDYGAMKNMFALQERRHGIKSRIVSVPNHPKSDKEIIQIYSDAISDKTKLLMVCHMINITGHIMPIRKICDMAHSRGVDVMVDGAHAFSHIQFQMKDLDCDYYGASLHKWLSTPLGAGLLYAKKSKIAQIWPLFAEGDIEDDNIKKLNHTGTHPVHTDLAILNALDFQEKIGLPNKEARLRFLQRYWTDQLRGYSNVIINTPEDLKRSCAIANVGIAGIEPKDLTKRLLNEYKIWTVAIDGFGVHGCRITPNLFTNTDELDIFVRAIKELAHS
jgi:selenocysteine lyase/cysteine desulfurase